MVIFYSPGPHTYPSDHLGRPEEGACGRAGVPHHSESCQAKKRQVLYWHNVKHILRMSVYLLLISFTCGTLNRAQTMHSAVGCSFPAYMVHLTTRDFDMLLKPVRD